MRNTLTTRHQTFADSNPLYESGRGHLPYAIRRLAYKWMISAHGMDQFYCDQEEFAVDVVNTAKMLWEGERRKAGHIDVFGNAVSKLLEHHTIANRSGWPSEDCPISREMMAGENGDRRMQLREDAAKISSPRQTGRVFRLLGSNRRSSNKPSHAKTLKQQAHRRRASDVVD